MPIDHKKHAAEAAAPARIHRPDVQPRARVRRNVPPVAALPTAAPSRSVTPHAPAPSTKTDYDVGYRKPPKHSQFKKGESGNKKGRPKGAKGLKTIARELLSETVTVRTPAGTRRMRKIEAMFHKVMEKAFSGDMRAIQSMLQHYALSVPDEPLLTAALASVPSLDSDAHDEAILEALRQTLRNEDDPS